MLLILLKSSACLAVFLLFYKLCLEKTSAHTFKRFYLITVILISIGIPFIAFTEYIETEPVNLAIASGIDNIENTVTHESTSTLDYTPIILWSIYILGVIIFSLRFFKNLYHIFQKIKANPKYKNQNYINVLLQDLVHPHTFFNYIFLNKNKYEHNLIPQEILFHEQVHAKQKHAIDILFIEVLQIAFWFNPLLYLIKKDIKLNHEFLADQAVINKGTNTKHYQKLLLAFSSNASHNPLANAINYSLIKKRFTVMKTQTSKPVIWLRSFIILPLLAILIYSFSSRDIIETQLENSVTSKERGLINSQTNPQEVDSLKNDEQTSTKTLIIKVIDNETISINKKKCLLIDFEKRIINLVDSLSTKEKEGLSPIIVYDPNSPGTDKTLSVLNNILRKHNLLRVNSKIIFSKETATPEQIKEYNSLINKYEKTGFLNSKERYNMRFIYDLFMSPMQREENKKYPKTMKGNPEILQLNITREDVKNNPEIIKQIEEYNQLAKKFNSNPKGVFKAKEIKRVIGLYNLMSDEQKKSVEPFPNFPLLKASETTSVDEVITIFTNSSGQFLVDNQLGTLKSIEAKLKNTKKKFVLLIHAHNTPQSILKKIQALLSKYNVKVKVETYDNSQITFPLPLPTPLIEKKSHISDTPTPPPAPKTPESQKDYKSKEEMNKIKERLYLYLLKKREDLNDSLNSEKNSEENQKRKKFIEKRLAIIEKDLENGTLKFIKDKKE